MALPSFLTLRNLGLLSGVLGIALAAASVFGWVQTERLGAARETIEAREVTIEALKGAVSDRDILIGRQNEAVSKLHAKSEADRTEYLERLAAADKRAQSSRARPIASLRPPPTPPTSLDAAAQPSS